MTQLGSWPCHLLHALSAVLSMSQHAAAVPVGLLHVLLVDCYECCELLFQLVNFMLGVNTDPE